MDVLSMKLYEYNMERNSNCSSYVAWWNTWDHEHLYYVHGQFRNSKILSESNESVVILTQYQLPFIKIKKSEIINGINMLDLVILTKLGNSKSEVRRMIKNNGLKINNVTISDETKIFYQNDFSNEEDMKISHGKKKHVIVKIT